METKCSHHKRRTSLDIFLLLAFGITWLCWIPSLLIADAQGYGVPTIANFTQLGQTGFINTQHVLVSIVFSLAVYGPLIGGIVAIRIESGKEGLSALFKKIVKWKVAIKWYAIVIVIAIIIPLLPRLIADITGQVNVQTGETISWSVPLLAGLFLWQLVTSGLGEEPGWRGYLLPHLQSRYGKNKAIWILGFVWAVWHYPFTIYDTATKMGAVPLFAAIITILIALIGQTMSLIGMTYLYNWFYNNTKSVFLAIFFHALSNFVPRLLLIGVSPSVNILITVMPWIVVFVLEKMSILGKEEQETV